MIENSRNEVGSIKENENYLQIFRKARENALKAYHHNKRESSLSKAIVINSLNFKEGKPWTPRT